MTDILAAADGFRLGTAPTDADVENANKLIDRLSAEVERLRAERDAAYARGLKE